MEYRFPNKLMGPNNHVMQWRSHRFLTHLSEVRAQMLAQLSTIKSQSRLFDY